MECESEIMMIPCFDFRKGGVALEEGSEEWKQMSKEVIEACESHGFFLLMSDEIIPKSVPEEMFKGMKELFDLPEETKKQHTSPNPYRIYSGKNSVIPFRESFGIDGILLSDSTEAFTNLMWPQGNPPFCETLKTMSLKMQELSFLVMKMIVEGYGLPQHYISEVEKMKSSNTSHMIKYNVHQKKKNMIKYKVPNNSNSNFETVLPPHTDKSALAILCQKDVQGLQVLSKRGKWIELDIPQHGFVVIIGDLFKAWSNGRLHAAKHKVVMSGDKERYTFAVFAIPKDEVEIEVPYELVDDEIHPLCYRSFSFGDYFSYFFLNPLEDDALELFAGL